MTANLLSVIEQQQKALKHAIKWLNICDKPRECMPLHAALAAGQQALEQAQVEQFCYCNQDVSLQMVSGGGAPEGYLGKVTLRIGDQYRDYYTHPQATEPAPSTDKTKEYSMRDWFNDLDNPHANR